MALIVSIYVASLAIGALAGGIPSDPFPMPTGLNYTAECKDYLTVQSYDGYCNNLEYPMRGMNGTGMIYDIIPPFFNASYQPVITIDPRYISNELMSNGEDPSPWGTSFYTPELANPRFNLFGLYFIQLAGNHEIENGVQGDNATLAYGDVKNDPVYKPYKGNLFNPQALDQLYTNADIFIYEGGVPFYTNGPNGWIDNSIIYSSDPASANMLRKYEDGMLWMSNWTISANGSSWIPEIFNYTLYNQMPSGDMVHVEYDPAINEDVPPYLAEVGGDVRDQENAHLSTIVNVFLRNHNYHARTIKEQYPNWSDEQIYQTARVINTAEYQQVVYDELIPSYTGMPLAPYMGYDSSVDGSTLVAWDTTLGRPGHALLWDEDIYDVCDNTLVTTMTKPPVPGYKFNDNRLVWLTQTANYGPKYPGLMLSDPISYAMASNLGKSDGMENVMYSSIITPSAVWGPIASNSLRNIVYGVDLLATDIIRSRTSGVRPYDDLRAIFNSHGSVYNDPRCAKTQWAAKDSLQCFEVITSNKTLAAKLQKIYGKASMIDGLVGILCEDPLPGHFASETAGRSANYVFQKKRDGDRFYYQNTQQYGTWLKDYVNGVTMKTLLERNTQLTGLPDNVFIAPMPSNNTIKSTNQYCMKRAMSSK